MIELTFLKELMLIKQVSQNLSLLVFLIKGFTFQSYVGNRSHDLVRMPMNLSDITIINIKDSDYCCVINRNNKREAKILI